MPRSETLPVMNGLEAARVLKRHMPKVPIVMFSIHRDAFTEKEVRSAGVAALISKFEDMSKLLGIVRNLLCPTTLDHLSTA
jgi:DNA-binding NarL/FixJ family response regulator